MLEILARYRHIVGMALGYALARCIDGRYIVAATTLLTAAIYVALCAYFDNNSFEQD